MKGSPSVPNEKRGLLTLCLFANLGFEDWVRMIGEQVWTIISVCQRFFHLTKRIVHVSRALINRDDIWFGSVFSVLF